MKIEDDVMVGGIVGQAPRERLVIGKVISFSTQDSPEAVANFYRTEMPKAGWTLADDLETQTSNSMFFYYSKMSGWVFKRYEFYSVDLSIEESSNDGTRVKLISHPFSRP